MSGYTPLFGSLTTGTLCGRWPDIGLWPIVLSLADRHGIVDVTPQYLAGVTGLPVADVTACMKRFCEPDAYSRSAEQGGARLVLLDDHRDWGWRIVNHGMYREKARKAAYDSHRTASGADADRKKASREVPTRPAKSRADPLSDSNADSNANTDRNGERAVRSTATRLPANFELTEVRREVAKAEGIDPDREFPKFCDHWLASSGANARKHNWDATWRNWCRKAADFKGPRPAGADPPKRVWRPDPADDDPDELARARKANAVQ